MDPDAVLVLLAGTGSWTRRQALVHDTDGHLAAWLSVHDRAAGRTLVEVTVTPHLVDEAATPLALALFGAGERHAVDIAGMRGVPTTLLDSGAYADDARQQAWLTAAGFRHARTWLQMTRPVDPGEATSLPGPRAGVTVRPVDRHDDGLPVAQDLQDVHRVLEESFEDHFSSYRRAFPSSSCACARTPGTAGTTGGWPRWRPARAPCRPGRSSRRCSTRTPRAPRAVMLTTSASTVEHAVAGWRSRCCTP